MKSLLLCLVLAPLLAASAQQTAVVSTYAPPKNSTILTTTFVDWDSLTANPTAVGQVRSVFDNPTVAMDKLEVHITTLNPRHGVAPGPSSFLGRDAARQGRRLRSLHQRPQAARRPRLPGLLRRQRSPTTPPTSASRPPPYYVINFVTDLSHATSAKSAAEQAVPGKLPSSVIDCNRQPSTPTPTGSRVVRASARPRSPSSRWRATSPHSM
jgi:hypothetical protein